METAPAIFALIAVWISGIWTDFFTWLDKPASNGIIMLGGLCLFMPIRSLEKQNGDMRQKTANIDKRFTALCERALSIENAVTDSTAALKDELTSMMDQWLARHPDANS